ncbi:MAG: hypothetical protein JNK48_26760 [Bryobacterales bacterium]|nr:hypothetical protein [Bryobacterales bacterium]
MSLALLTSEFLPAERKDPSVVNDWHSALVAWSPLTNLMDAAAGMILLLNEQRQILFANAAFRREVGVELPRAVIGLRTGEALGCPHSEISPGGCGTTRHCRSCLLARAIVDAIQWGDTGGAPRAVRLQRFGGAVLALDVAMFSVVVGTERLLLCRIGDLAPLPTHQVPGLEHCPMHLLELYLALTTPHR